MADLTAASRLAARFVVLEWRWDRKFAHDLVNSLGGTLKSQVQGRDTFRLPGGQTLSVYHADDAVRFLEVTIDAFLETDRLSDAEFEDKADEFFAKYEEVVTLVSSVLSKPLFDNGFGNPGFPKDQEAQWLALWPLKNARLMVEQKNEDRELPFRISLVVAP